MRRLFALLALTVVIAAACSDDEAAAPETTTTTTSTTTTTTVAPLPGSYCDGVAEVNVALDDIARTMLSTLAGDPAGEFIVVLDDAVDLLDHTAGLAPPDAADATRLLADTYADFEELLFEIDFMVADLPTDDPRATALSSAEFAEAVTTMTEACA